MPGVSKSDLDNFFVYHAPSEADVVRYQRIRDAAKAFATIILDNTPNCPDQTVAIRKVREATMDANAAIACYGDPLTPA